MNRYEDMASEAQNEPSLRQQLEEAAGQISYLHERMDEVEDRIFGTRPRVAATQANALGTPQPMQGITASAKTITNLVSDLHQRFSKLLAQI